MGPACACEGCDSENCVQLTGRESMVCNVICNSAEPVSFSDLRRTTSLHQEVVSRIVRRLAIHGLVKKVDGKYQSLCCN